MFNQEVTEGYVFSSLESGMWVIELTPEETDGKNQEEILELLNEKADESDGAFYDLPFLNRISGTAYEEGKKVKIYWTGVVLQSAPAQIKDTLLILKADD